MANSDAQLESRIATFDPALKLFIAIAAKVSTLHALSGRYSQRLTLADLSPSPSRPSSPTRNHDRDRGRDTASAQRALDAEQTRVQHLLRATVADATAWLVVVCAHLGVDMAQLPDAPDEHTRLVDALDVGGGAAGREDESEEERGRRREQREWEVVYELVLVSLGLVGAGQQAAEPDKDAKATKVGAASLVGGLFGSSSSSSSSSSPSAKSSAPREPSKPPPLNYTALSRALVVSTADVLGISSHVVADVERAISQTLFFQFQQQSDADQRKVDDPTGSSGGVGGGGRGWDDAAREYRDKAAKKGNALKWAATGAGVVLGGVAIGLTGGLAAPAIAAGLGTFGISAFSGAGGAVLIGTLLGLGGGGLAGYRTHRRMKGLDEVSFEPIKDDGHEDVPQIPSLTATIVASGFLLDLKDSVDPWRPFVRSSKVDAYALKADPLTFLEAGRSLDSFIKNRLIQMGGTELVKRTALAAVYAGVALPLTVFKSATTAFDSEFTQCKDKARKAGVLLAEILEKEVQGKRPVVLIGYGPGASLILSCLQHLHALELGHLVYDAVLVSLPDSPSAVAWAEARSVVAHELVNAYSANDWVLGIAARLYTLSTRIAGLRPVQVEGVTDINISDLLGAHMDLRTALPRILERCGDKRGEQPVLGSVGGGGGGAAGAGASKVAGQGEQDGAEAARDVAEKGLRDLALGEGGADERDARDEAERLGREVEREARR
ncbi:uncharacterized protein RHOBADRAFT_56590 [Rhodotorula graminis WP1]|uniref:DUF726-domain-containing protein n=1 Tax=Rhodotorula graminis (strain WP1) TaxID=578459 RepID=A0A0P9F7A6_RHOGW|nr:uncharacterized protein RHOBADRAFT_56590 [Rhodotorula graminis WP1]KPV71554.1 hypothetical protein RHOBADRAFT_56590 [Rhodotorula graminis WP1]